MLVYAGTYMYTVEPLIKGDGGRVVEPTLTD